MNHENGAVVYRVPEDRKPTELDDVTGRAKTSINASELDELAKHKDAHIRGLVAKNPYVPRGTWFTLTKDTHTAVRADAARNMSGKPSRIEEMAKQDESTLVREAAIETLKERGFAFAQLVPAPEEKETFVKDAVTSPSAKLSPSLLPVHALEAVTRVLEYGAKKYGRDNWRRAPRWSIYYDAATRHLWAWWRGEDKDPDTGESHLAHAVCSLLFLLEFERLSLSKDDRIKDDER